MLIIFDISLYNKLNNNDNIKNKIIYNKNKEMISHNKNIINNTEKINQLTL